MDTFEEKVTDFLKEEIPFVFIIDFPTSNKQVYSFEEAAAHDIFFNIRGTSNDKGAIQQTASTAGIDLHPNPISFATYQNAFETVKKELRNGNSFLLNLTFPTELNAALDLKDIYRKAAAPYTLLYKDQFVVFSPECYLKFNDGHVYSYPMKGTINSTIPDAMAVLLSNKKELHEHNTIIDLIRNDLSMISKEVQVTKFRYVDRIKSGSEELLQTSTEIRGKLPLDWKNNFAKLLLSTLPAGSISGAPKNKTLEIINQVESKPRGFYTGIFGIYDGKNIDSAVSIRFIEKDHDRYYFRSGGGITHLSILEEEYRELLEKIYVPTV